ncbi:MAG: hypothetical protein WCE80_13050 [Acidimicrobiia bacterium]|jgi:hypothetical protein
MIFGYLDAGSGSLILQAILGGAAGIAVAFKAWKAKLAGKPTAANAEAPNDVDDQPAISET